MVITTIYGCIGFHFSAGCWLEYRQTPCHSLTPQTAHGFSLRQAGQLKRHIYRL